jgi:hypothetical protein
MSFPIVFKLIKHEHRDFSNQFLPEPFAVCDREQNTLSRSHVRVQHTDLERAAIREYDLSLRRNARISKNEIMVDDPDFPAVLSFDAKLDIIGEWQQQMSTSALKRGCCAICAHNVLATELVLVDVALVPLHLLRNDCLPDYTLPSNYDFELYARAILYSKGLTDCWTLSDIFMCPSCHSYLICKSPQQPVNSLANFQYYGHHRLPADIQDAFSSASIYDLMLVSRARASQVVMCGPGSA